MKKIPSWGIVFVAFGLGVILLSFIFEIPQGEGYNPSDDGVILAQSYRLLNGEIPHADFISIRPVGSAIFHTISFVLPFPLEPTARWIVLLEFLLTSMLWCWMLFKTLPKSQRSSHLLVLLLSLIFVFTQNYYNLFPWTTIDAIFFFSIGFFVFWNWKDTSLSSLESIARFFTVIFFIGFAALCRQTFALPALVLGLVMLFQAIREKRMVALAIGGLVGLWPYILYYIVLARRGAVESFYLQLTGRTELWQTGFVKYWDQFWTSPFLWVYISILAIFLYVRIASLDKDKTRLHIVRKIMTYVLSLLLVLVVVMFFTQADHLFSTSFVLFWLFAIILISQPLFVDRGSQFDPLNWWIIFLAWVSSISLGDNSPVFASGILAGGVFVVIATQLDTYASFRFWNKGRWSLLFYVFTLTIIGFGINAQKVKNYRDLPSEDLKFEMSAFLYDMGAIRTNSRTFEYMHEIKSVFDSLGRPVGRFVVLPNGSLIYPMLKSPNPMPIDWMQGAEFIGQEDDLFHRLERMDKEGGIFLLFDKFNMKRIDEELLEQDFNPDHYPYYRYLIQNSETIDEFESDWFEIRLWQ